MKTIYKFYILFAVALMVSSCENYLDVNDSEVDATEEVVTPDLLLGGAITQPHRTFVTDDANELGNVFMNNWAGDVNNVTGGFLDEFELDLTTGFRSQIWDNTYRSLGTYQSIISYPGDDYANHRAIARILKTYYFQYLVDTYGDIPYFQALQGPEILTPAYDDDQEIYRDFIVQLDLALSEMSEDANAVGMEDVVYGGDMSMWVKFANTLKLRILIRESLLPASAGYVAEQMAALSNNFIGVGESALIDPPYENVSGKQSPFYEQYGFDTASPPVPTFDYNFITPTEYAAEFLKGNVTEVGFATGVADPRLTRIYRALPGLGVVGVQQGATNLTAPSSLSELGPGLIVSSSQPGYLFTAAESLFLQAEAAQYLNLPGNAETFFEQAITESFTQLGIPGDAAGYITASTNTARIGWNGPSDKRDVIMTQKWIALNGINGLESWIEYTRTGFPAVPLAISATRAAKPNRLLYPSSEYSTNIGNVPTQTVDDAFNTKIFWDAN